MLKISTDGSMTKVGSDHADGIECIGITFNNYVNPDIHPEFWDQRSITVHGVLPDDNRIKIADNMLVP